MNFEKSVLEFTFKLNILSFTVYLNMRLCHMYHPQLAYLLVALHNHRHKPHQDCYGQMLEHLLLTEGTLRQSSGIFTGNWKAKGLDKAQANSSKYSNQRRFGFIWRAIKGTNLFELIEYLFIH